MKYRLLVPMVDVIFADVAQPDQARIVGLNAHIFLKNEGGVLISIKASCIDSTAKPEVVFAHEVERLRAEKIKPKERKFLVETYWSFKRLTSYVQNSHWVWTESPPTSA